MTFNLIGAAPAPAFGIIPAAQNPTPAQSARAQQSQDKLTFALVDSGMGGGMAAAHLYGPVPQFASYFCLPIGDKPEHMATAYTAAMALWPLVAPLADNDGHIAESVIIACNSASVRREKALTLMKDYCARVADDPANRMGLDGSIRANILALHSKIEQDPDYLSRHVREIVTETAKTGVAEVSWRLRNEDSAFVRVDSTNGTANSAAYPARFLEELRRGADGGRVDRHTFANKVTTGGDDYVINHDVFVFKSNGQQKVVVLESRGNPPWVPAIEGNRPEPERLALVQTSLRASETAVAMTKANPAFQALARSGEAGAVIERCLDRGRGAPDINMLSCTHYPAMRDSLARHYDDPGVVFVDQAAVVASIARELDPRSVDPERGPLHLSMTVGSQNYGGTPSELKKSVPDGDATARTLFTVLDATLRQRRLNEPHSIGSVRIYDQVQPAPAISGESPQTSLQDQFEAIHRVIGLPLKAEILAEQGLEEVPNAASDEAKYRLRPEWRDRQIQPRCTDRMKEIVDSFSPRLREQFERIGELVTLGEARGIDKLAPYNAQGEQLMAAVARIHEVAERNRTASGPHERVGILTGFSVVNNATGARIGGENDGPPGAVVMARSLLERGVPVTLVTDRSAEASLIAALVGSGLAQLTPEAQRRVASGGAETLTHHDIVPLAPATEDLLHFEIPDYDNRAGTPDRQAAATAVRDSAARLRDARVTTMISIERPSPTTAGDFRSMVGIDIGAYNLDTSPLLRSADLGFKPVTIGIGDGGNELGTGGIAHITTRGRDERLEPFVKRGDIIAANPKHATDVMVLGTVSNHPPIAVAMLAAAADMECEPLAIKLRGITENYNQAIRYMHAVNMSLDGVNKENLLTVDGRRLGSVEQARQRFEAGGHVPLGVGPTGKEGADGDTTHNDVFLKFERTLLGLPIQSRL